MERVSVLLGHASVRVTGKHYAPWVRARQAQLEADVMRRPAGAFPNEGYPRGTREIPIRQLVENKSIKNGGGGGSRTRVRKSLSRRAYILSPLEVSVGSLERTRKNQPSPIDFSLGLRTEARGQSREMTLYPAVRARRRERADLIRRRRLTACCCWQLLWSDRLTGARNPVCLFTTVQSRRIRYAPLSKSLLSSYRAAQVGTPGFARFRAGRGSTRS